jgi:hypothetical protein
MRLRTFMPDVREALARLPRVRWRAVAPADPLLRWLALDGLGFHQAYFDTRRYVTDRWRPAGYPAWPGRDEYAHRAVDQGIGRALWFVNGADPAAVAGCIETFPVSRRADLCSGAGLASVYAGGVDAGGLAAFWEAAGRYQPEVAQGAAFAAKARLRTDLVVPHTELAVKTYCDLSIEDAAAVTDHALADLPPTAPCRPTRSGGNASRTTSGSESSKVREKPGTSPQANTGSAPR